MAFISLDDIAARRAVALAATRIWNVPARLPVALYTAAQREGFGTSLGSSVMTLPQSDGDAEGVIRAIEL